MSRVLIALTLSLPVFGALPSPPPKLKVSALNDRASLPSQGLVGYYPMITAAPTSALASTTLTDYSGAGNNCTWKDTSGATAAPYAKTTSIFLAADRWADCGAPRWITTAAANGFSYCVVAKGGTTNDSYARWIDFGTSTWVGPRGGSTFPVWQLAKTPYGNHVLAFSASAVDSAFYHVYCGTQSGTTAKTFVDGVKIAQDTSGPFVENPLNHIWIGKSNYVDPYFSGYLASVVLYSRELSEAVVSDISTKLLENVEARFATVPVYNWIDRGVVISPGSPGAWNAKIAAVMAWDVGGTATVLYPGYDTLGPGGTGSSGIATGSSFLSLSNAAGSPTTTSPPESAQPFYDTVTAKWWALKRETSVPDSPGDFSLIYTNDPTIQGAWQAWNGGSLVLSRGAGGEWDDQGYFTGRLLLAQGRYWIFGNARKVSNLKEQVGCAYRNAADGIAGTYTKCTGNPIIPNAGSGIGAWLWADPQVIPLPGGYLMYLTGAETYEAHAVGMTAWYSSGDLEAWTQIAGNADILGSYVPVSKSARPWIVRDPHLQRFVMLYDHFTDWTGIYLRE